MVHIKKNKRQAHRPENRLVVIRGRGNGVKCVKGIKRYKLPVIRDGMGREVGGGSGLGTRVHPWWIHVDVWQNQYSIVK